VRIATALQGVKAAGASSAYVDCAARMLKCDLQERVHLAELTSHPLFNWYRLTRAAEFPGEAARAAHAE
jgi:hypothetical protein